jgi:osmotically-inducible protein OsmY
MRVLHAAAVIALLAGPAYAQQKSVPKYGDAPVEKTRSQIEEDRKAESAYKRSLGNIQYSRPHPYRPLGQCAQRGCAQGRCQALSGETEDQDQRHRKLEHDPVCARRRSGAAWRAVDP